jgi:hypothetical protein
VLFVYYCSSREYESTGSTRTGASACPMVEAEVTTQIGDPFTIAHFYGISNATYLHIRRIIENMDTTSTSTDTNMTFIVYRRYTT